MSNNDNKNEFLETIQNAIDENTFAKITLSGYIGKENELKNLYAKIINVKTGSKFNFVYRYQKKDITKNYEMQEGILILSDLIGRDYKIATLLSLKNDVVYEKISADKSRIRYNKPSLSQLPGKSHDNVKVRKISKTIGKTYLNLLDITDSKGKVLAKSQDKFKQINHYIEILSPLLKDFDTENTIKIADMGSGKGYLTFALYDYLKNELGLNVRVTGVEFRKELVDLCNDIAVKSGFESLDFIEGEIQNFDVEKLDVIIALHACDTATDDAIAKGINSGAQLIVTAPCCQHQIRQEIERVNHQNVLSPIIKHGIFLERQAELITDGLRALLLEYFGYKTKAIEFIADAHTHKNVMIIGQKTNVKTQDENILKQISEIKEVFGVSKHYLENLMQL
ncbi:MAG: SAM-dependent methyltransferase [Bacteroidales bacterium]|nr:SAM-dependent methyltransferase [Bacteroidales bacterium]